MSTKLLIVDDDEDILEALKLVFESEEYNVKTLSKGENAYKTAVKFKPDVIILDILLSGVDGRVICKKLRVSKDTQDIPIILFSAYSYSKKIAETYGADDFISKPFDIQKLIDKVDKYSGKKLLEGSN